MKKVTRIQIDGVIGIQSVDVKPKTAITLFAGDNGSGKSSIQESIWMAICQDHVRGITVKKEFDQLVNDCAKAGGAQITFDNDLDKTFAFNMPKGDFSGPEIPEAMRVAMYGQRFAKMEEDQRRTFLFGLSKIKPNADNVKVRMLKLGCEESKVDAVLPLLRTGFPSTCAHAKSKATEAKGAWRALTGETYGEKKAETWTAPVPENETQAPVETRDKLISMIEALDKNINAMNQNLGAIKNAARTAQQVAEKRAALHTQAMTVDRCRDNLERAKADLAAYEPGVIELRTRAAGKARVGLVHDMASFIQEMCEAICTEAGGELIERYEAEFGKLGQTIDVDAQARLPEQENGLKVLQNRATNLQRDLDAAIQAKADFDALAPAENVTDAVNEIANVEEMIATAKADRQKADTQRVAIEAEIKASNEAVTKTADAKAHHQSVLGWIKVADALAPDGIPGEMLSEALAPINKALEQASLDTGWTFLSKGEEVAMKIVIGADMSITAHGRPSHMFSKSERWRCNAMIAQVVAELSGLKILMLDEVDILDLPGRVDLFGWLDVLVQDDIIETALLFATLKGLPTGMPDTVESFWVEDGRIKDQPKLAAA